MALQRSVQQQNALAKERMRLCASLFDAERKLHWLREVLQERGHDPDRGALVRLEQIPEQDGAFCSGAWIGPDLRFWEFTATVSRGANSVAVESFAEATNRVVVTEHGLGTGKSFGQLAIEVLRERRGTAEDKKVSEAGAPSQAAAPSGDA